jgi:hypothetical protein
MDSIARPFDNTTLETISSIFKFMPIEATIGSVIIVIFLVYLFVKEPILITLTFILVSFSGGYLRNILATQPFFEMYQIYRGGSGYYVETPKDLDFLYFMNDQDWINAAFYYGLLLNLTISYITYYVIKNMIAYLAKKDIRFLLIIFSLFIKSISGNSIKNTISSITNLLKGSK